MSEELNLTLTPDTAVAQAPEAPVLTLEPVQDAAKAAELAKAYQQKKDEIDRLYQAWEELEAES